MLYLILLLSLQVQNRDAEKNEGKPIEKKTDKESDKEKKGDKASKEKTDKKETKSS